MNSKTLRDIPRKKSSKSERKRPISTKFGKIGNPEILRKNKMRPNKKSTNLAYGAAQRNVYPVDLETRQNEYLVVKFGVDTAENKPSKV